MKKSKTRTSAFRHRKNILTAYLFLTPAIILFFLFFYYPTITSFFYSLNEYHIFDSLKWVGFDNYKRMFQDNIFISSLKNSLVYLVIITPTLVVIPLLMALLINTKAKGAYIFRVIYYLPYITPMVSVAITWKYIFHPKGLLNAGLRMLGLPMNSVDWLFNRKLALPSIAIVEIWKLCGYYMIIYLAALQSIDKEQIEAVHMDGANAVKTLWYVTLPSIKNSIKMVLILATMNAVKIFTSVYIITGGGPYNATVSLPMYIYQKAFNDLDMGYASALGIIQWILLLGLTILNMKFNKTEEELD